MQAEIVEELEGHILECSMEHNGNHVIQKCIEFVDPILLKTIVHAVIENVSVDAYHSSACVHNLKLLVLLVITSKLLMGVYW